MTQFKFDSRGRYCVYFQCPGCGRSLKTPIEHIVKKARCRACGLTFLVPERDKKVLKIGKRVGQLLYLGVATTLAALFTMACGGIVLTRKPLHEML